MRPRIPAFRFGKPKGPGFGISKTFYLTVLCPVPVLPSIQDIVAPKPENGAMEGFGVPLVDGNDKSLLQKSMVRGQYAIATKDQRTVLRLSVLPRQDIGFDPEVVATSALALQLMQETIDRIRATWTICQFVFESHDPDVYPAIDFLLGIVFRLSNLVGGVVADPIAQRYLLPNEILMTPRIDPEVDARELVGVHILDRGASCYMRTLGMQKFNLPELEIDNVPIQLEPNTRRFLFGICQGQLKGFAVKPGSRVEAKYGEFEAQPGGMDAILWGKQPLNFPVIELLPPTGKGVGDLLNGY
jgi:hypothetical protein